MCLVLSGAQVEGTAIPEAVPVKDIVPEAEVTTGAASEPAETAAPEVTEEVHDDALPKTSMDVVVRGHRCRRPQRLVVTGSNFWQIILSPRRQ
jgi:hypothetical protein